MRKGDILKSWIAFLLTGVLTVFLLIGLFHRESSADLIGLLLLMLSVSYLLLYIAVHYFMNKKMSFYERLAIGLLCIIVLKTVFIIAAERFLFVDAYINYYPLDILLLIVLAYIHPFAHALLYGVFISGVNIAYDYMNYVAVSLENGSSMVATIFIAAVTVSLISHRERRERARLEGVVKAMQKGARAVISNSDERDKTMAVLSRGEKDRASSDLAHKAINSIGATLEMVRKMLNCHNCLLFDSDKRALTLIAAAQDKDICYEIPNESADNLPAWIAEHRIPLKISQVRYGDVIGYYTRDKDINSFMGVPVFGDGDKLKAILCADSVEKDVFNSETERLLVMTAHGISQFLENNVVLRQIQTEAAEFTAFYNLSRKLGSTLKIDEILDIAVNSSKEIVDHDMAALILKEEPDVLKVALAKGLKASEISGKTFKMDEGIIGLTMKNGKSLCFSDFQEGKRDIQIFPGIFLPVRSLLCTPLLLKDDVVGVLIMASRRENFFSSYETRIFEVISTYIAIAITNARVYMQMERMATTDGLTGLFNHRHFQESLSRELERAERYKHRLSLLLTDVDHFKKINDTYGHPAGDKILKDVSRILVSAIRNVDMAARYGGEEFAIILINTDNKGALDIAERIRRLIEDNVFDVGNTRIKITVSIGMAVFPEDVGLPEYGGGQRLLISRADSALYLAKKEGRNKVYLFKDVAGRIERDTQDVTSV